MKPRLVLGLILLSLSIFGIAQQTGSSETGNRDDSNLDALVDRISHTKALGVFTKLSLKKDIDGLLKSVGDYHKGIGENTLDELHELYDAMVHKLVALLQDKDKELVKSIDQSRDKVWLRLADKNEFKRLQ